ncbi:MAG: hypothetical protein J6C90_02380, partial [Clostridia bacterium]|nr:hypothetical protein [Clostridia bacterium]
SIDGAGAITPSLGANWNDGGDGYYYYGTKASPLAMTAEQTFCTGATLATSTTSQGNITIELTVEAIQVSNNTNKVFG